MKRLRELSELKLYNANVSRQQQTQYICVLSFETLLPFVTFVLPNIFCAPISTSFVALKVSSKKIKNMLDIINPFVLCVLCFLGALGIIWSIKFSNNKTLLKVAP